MTASRCASPTAARTRAASTATSPIAAKATRCRRCGSSGPPTNRARAMLREAGLMDSTRNAPDSFLSMGLRGTSAEAGRRDDMQQRAQRMKFGLLAVIVVVVALGFQIGRAHV